LHDDDDDADYLDGVKSDVDNETWFCPVASVPVQHYEELSWGMVVIVLHPLLYVLPQLSSQMTICGQLKSLQRMDVVVGCENAEQSTSMEEYNPCVLG
jgi:hypothetical protein